MNNEPIVASVDPPSPVRPPRPEMYALAVFVSGKWCVYYGGSPRDWIEESQQPMYEGSHLIVIPGAKP